MVSKLSFLVLVHKNYITKVVGLNIEIKLDQCPLFWIRKNFKTLSDENGEISRRNI
jgi:hypothetical protein